MPVKPWVETSPFPRLTLLDPPSRQQLLEGIDPLTDDDDIVNGDRLRILARALGADPRSWTVPWLPRSAGKLLIDGWEPGPISGALVGALLAPAVAMLRRPGYQVPTHLRRLYRQQLREFRRAVSGDRPLPQATDPITWDEIRPHWQRVASHWRENRRVVRAWSPEQRERAQARLLQLGMLW